MLGATGAPRALKSITECSCPFPHPMLRKLTPKETSDATQLYLLIMEETPRSKGHDCVQVEYQRQQHPDLVPNIFLVKSHLVQELCVAL